MKHEMTLAEVSKELNIARQTAGLIERRAMEKFKELMEQKGIKIEDLLKDE